MGNVLAGGNSWWIELLLLLILVWDPKGQKHETKIKSWNCSKSGSSSAETKLSCIKTELKRCIMTESRWNKYNISRKSPEVLVKRSPKVARKEGHLNWTHRGIRLRRGGKYASGLATWLSGKGVGLWLADFPWYAPDLWLTCDHFVGKASAIGQPTGPPQPPTLSGTGNE